MKCLNKFLIRGILSLVFIYVFSSSTLAQTSNPFSVKFYTGLYYGGSVLVHPVFRTITALRFESMGPAISWKSGNGNFQEAAFFGVINKFDDGVGKGEYEKFGLRYEYNFVLNAQTKKKIHLYLGGSISSFYTKYEQMTLGLLLYNRTYKIKGIIIHATPRLIYNFNKKFFLDFNIPISFFNTEIISIKNNDSSLTDKQALNTYLEFRFLEGQRVFRLGLGYKF